MCTSTGCSKCTLPLQFLQRTFQTSTIHLQSIFFRSRRCMKPSDCLKRILWLCGGLMHSTHDQFRGKYVCLELLHVLVANGQQHHLESQLFDLIIAFRKHILISVQLLTRIFHLHDQPLDQIYIVCLEDCHGIPDLFYQSSCTIQVLFSYFAGISGSSSQQILIKYRVQMNTNGWP